MPNPLLIEEPFWDGRRILSAAIVVLVLVLTARIAGGEATLRLLISAIAPLACLWVPYAVANFPLAGAMFSGRPLSHRSAEDSVVIIGWILLLVWVGYASSVMATGSGG